MKNKVKRFFFFIVPAGFMFSGAFAAMSNSVPYLIPRIGVLICSILIGIITGIIYAGITPSLEKKEAKP